MRIYLILSGIRWITVWSGLNLLAEKKKGTGSSVHSHAGRLSPEFAGGDRVACPLFQ